MENSWRGSLWRQPCPPPLPPTTPPPLVPSSSLHSHTQLSYADCHIYFQPLHDSVRMTPDHVLSNTHGLDNLGHSEFGASFSSLISGSLAHMPCDQQLVRNTVPVTSLLPPSNRTANGSSGGSRVAVMPGVSWSHNMDHPHWTSGETFPLKLSATAHCINNSQIPQAASLDVKKSLPVSCQTSHDKDKVMSFYSPIANNTCGTRVQKYPDITASQKIPGESNVSSSYSFLHVVCCGISGTLLLSDTGLLGVVCTCHGLYMSISKFSEHSGSRDVDPGNAVIMDNGETVAHWWNAFSSRTGIRVVEGYRGWDWPEGFSVASGLTNQPISSMLNIPIPLNQVSSFRASVSYEQKNYRVINSKGTHSCRNMVDECIYCERDRAPRECTNSFLKYLTSSAHEFLPHAVGGEHARGLPNSYFVQSEKASQSVAPTLDIICDSENSLPAIPNLQDSKTSRNGFRFERLGVSSSFELRLGQSPEKSQTLEAKHQLSTGSNLNGVHEEPSKVFFHDKLLLTTGNECQGRSTIQYADIYSNPPERRGPTELEHSRCVGAAYGSRTDCWNELSNISLGTTNINSNVLPGLRNHWTKCQLSNNCENSSECHVGEKLCYESNASERDKICLPWNSLPGTVKESGMDLSTAPTIMNEDKEVECDLNGLLAIAKANIEVSKESKGKASSFSLVLGESSTGFQVKSLDPHHMSTITVDKLYGTEFFNNNRKRSSSSDISHFNRDLVKYVQNPIVSEKMPLGFSSKSSDYHAAPTFPKETFAVIENGIHYRNEEMPAAWNKLERPDRDNGPPVRSVQECEIIKNPCVRPLVTTTPSISTDPTKLLDSLKMQRFLEMEDKSMLTSCWMGHNCERFRTMTGSSLYTEGAVLPTVEQLFLRPRGTECDFTHSKKEHSSQGLPYTSVPETCSSTAQKKYLTGENGLKDGNFCNYLKGDRSRAAAGSLNSKLNMNCMFLKETAKSFNRADSLVAPNIRSAESCSFQWRDVPNKIKENCSLTRKEQEAVSRSPLGCAEVMKSLTGFSQIAVSLKEQEVSNISSGCSAPDVTHSCSEVNKKDSSSAVVRTISFADSLVLDKRAGNDRSCSFDDGLDSELCPEFYGSTSMVNFIKGEPFKIVPRKQSLSLIEEIRLQNSLQSETSPYKTKRCYTFCEDSDHLQKFELAPKRRRKTVKWMKLDVSGHTSAYNKVPKCSEDMQKRLVRYHGSPRNSEDVVKRSEKHINSAFSAAKWVFRGKDVDKVHPQGEKHKTEAHKSVLVDDPLKASEMFRRKRIRLDDTSPRHSELRGVFYCGAELTAKLTSLGGCSNSLGKNNFKKWMVRPTVCGEYGIISNGNPSKPTKIIPLSEVLKTAVSLAGKGNKKADRDNKLKSTSVKVKKMKMIGRPVKGTALGMKVLKSQVKKCRTHRLQSIELESSENKESDTASCSATNGDDYLPCVLQKCNNHGITAKKPEDKTKAKFKEGRLRSLRELLFKGYGSEVVNSSSMKNPASSCGTASRYCGDVMANDVDARAQTSGSNKAAGCSEKHQRENSHAFCCVCGSSDTDEHNQLFRCNRFLLKSQRLRDEADAVDNKTVSYRRCKPHAKPLVTNSDSESLQPGDKLVCARTEGYMGQKREGLSHNHSRGTDRNGGCLVPQEQLNAWLHIHQQKPQRKGRPRLSTSKVESDCRKAYARYKQSKSWKHLVVYKSGIHALGLYTSQFISRGAMVVEYVGEIVGLRVADRREREYQSGKKLQHKSACYFFRIDKEHIIDATRKGGIARFVNHSCQPNCVAKVISVRTEKKVVFLAERDIYPGEEITYDYHFSNEEDEGEKIPCYCNSNNCRRFLN